VDLLNSKLYPLILNNLPLFIFTILVVERLKQLSKKNIISAWIVYFLSTFFHELSHYIVSLFTNGKPTKVSLLPSRSEDKKSIILGYVESSNITWYNGFLVGMSPLSLLVGVYFIDIYFFKFFEESIVSFFVYLFLIIIFIDSSLPSSQDFKVAFSSIFGVLFYMSLISFLLGVYFV